MSPAPAGPDPVGRNDIRPRTAHDAARDCLIVSSAPASEGTCRLRDRRSSPERADPEAGSRSPASPRIQLPVRQRGHCSCRRPPNAGRRSGPVPPPRRPRGSQSRAWRIEVTLSCRQGGRQPTFQHVLGRWPRAWVAGERRRGPPRRGSEGRRAGSPERLLTGDPATARRAPPSAPGWAVPIGRRGAPAGQAPVSGDRNRAAGPGDRPARSRAGHGDAGCRRRRPRRESALRDRRSRATVASRARRLRASPPKLLQGDDDERLQTSIDARRPHLCDLQRAPSGHRR